VARRLLPLPLKVEKISDSWTQKERLSVINAILSNMEDFRGRRVLLDMCRNNYKELNSNRELYLDAIRQLTEK